MELEEAIKELKRTIEENNRLLTPKNEQFFNKKEKQEIRMQNIAISTMLQALEELQQKEKSRIIGNINEIKIEDLEPILKPYYISKEKVRKELNDIENMIDKTTRGEIQKYTVGELMLFRTIYNKLLEE